MAKGKTQPAASKPVAKKAAGSAAAAAATASAGPGWLLYLIGLVLQLALLLVVLVLGWLTFVYFSPDVGRISPVVDIDVYFPDRPIDDFFDYSIASYETIGGLNVLKAGNPDGKMMILLHGFPETALLSWHHQITHFAKLGFFVVAPDQRGYNTSMKPADIDSYSLDFLGQDIIGLIDHFSREKAIVVGHDWGAAVAWHLGTQFSSRIEKLVILNVPHPHVMTQTLRSNWQQARNSWYILFFQFPWVPEQKIQKDNFRWLTGALAMSPPGTYPRAVVKLYHESWAQQGAVTGMLNWYRSAGKAILAGKKTNHRVPASLPTLMIWGDQDSALDASMAQPSVEMCDNGKLELIHGASHWVQHEEPERVNRAIEAFVSQ